MLKAIAGVALVLLIATVTACGGSETTTVVEEENAAQLEALQLEKEKAELEVEAAEVEAEKEKQEAKQAIAKAKSEPVSDESPERKPEPESEEVSAPPNVVGLPLSTAEQQLSAAGYTTAPVNTDTLFGIVDEDNYTICKQNPPRGDVVKVLAQKYGC